MFIICFILVTCENTNGQCVLVRPGENQCLCKPGYHGYKCLRQVSARVISQIFIL